MPKKLKSPFIRSLLLHGALIALIAIMVSHPSEAPSTEAPILIESISIGKEVKKALHAVVHTIGIPHSEPESDAVSDSTPEQKGVPPSFSLDSTGGASAGSEGSEMERYLAGIAARIDQKKRYPKAARFNEQEGLVRILIELSAKGEMLRVEIEEASPFALLNEAAIEAVRSVGALPPPPSGESAKSIVIHVPIHFRIDR